MLSVAAVAHAQYEDVPEEERFGKYFEEEVLDEVEDEGGAFVEAFETAGGTIPDVFTSAFSAFDPGYCGAEWIATDASLIVGTWLIPAMFVAMIVMFGIAVVYMAGQFLQSPPLIAIAKDEIWQTIVTVIRVLFIAVSIMTANLWYAIASDPGGGITDPVYLHSDDMLDAAMGFSRMMVVDMIDSYSLLVMYNMAIHTIYSSTMWVGVSFRAMYNFNLGPVLKPIIDIVGTSLQYLSLAISEWMVHIIILCFIKRWTWGLFIPLGILLRAIPHTRNAGEALFMLVFALGTLYPFMFIVDYEAHKLLEHNLVNGRTALTSFIANSGLFSIGGALVSIALLAGGVIFPFFLGSAVTIAFELIRASVYYIVMMGMLLPFLNIFVTLTLAREWAKIFNVNVNYLSFLKII